MQKNIRKILVAIDLSEYSAETMRLAAEIAENSNAQLIVANAINQRDVEAFEKIAEKSAYSLGDFIKHREEDRSEQIQKLIEETQCEHLTLDTISRIGVPFEVLIEIAHEESVDLVVMGQKGRGGLSDMLFGSNAEKMFRRCPVPLLSVRHRPPGQPGNNHKRDGSD